MKKAQIQTQIFVYILALIVIALILLYGYSSIKGFVKRSDEVNLVQFRTDFSNAVEMQSHEYRSVIKKQVLLPRGYNSIMILDLDKAANVSIKTEYPLIYESWYGQVKENVFLIGKSQLESFYAGKIFFDSNDNILIEAPDRVVELRLTGMGSQTKIERWE